MQDAVIRDDVKVLSDSPADVTVLHRFIAATKLSARPAWQQHSQILAQSVKIVETGGDIVGLEVSGYVKSKGMTADQLIHIPSYGTYQVRVTFVSRLVWSMQASIYQRKDYLPSGREGKLCEK